MKFIVSLILFVFTSKVAFSGTYGVNLANEKVYWGSVLSNERLPFVPGRGIVSSGPYFIDLNHRERALLVGPLVVWTNNHRPNGEPQTPLGRIDITNTNIRIKLTIEHSPWDRDEWDPLQGGQVVFWFQSALSRQAVAGGNYAMPPRAANYVYNRNLLPEALTGATVVIPIRSDMDDWTCLGDNPIDLRPFIGSSAKYTCALNHAEFAEAMSSPADMGFLFLLPSKNPDGAALKWLRPDNPYRTPTMGNTKFYLKAFTIERSR